MCCQLLYCLEFRAFSDMIFFVVTCIVAPDDDDKTAGGVRAADTAAGEFTSGAPIHRPAASAAGQSGVKRTLKRVKTMFYAGTEVRSSDK